MTKKFRVSAGKKNIFLRQTDTQPLSGNGRDVPWMWPVMSAFSFPALSGRSVTVTAVSQAVAEAIYQAYCARQK